MASSLGLLIWALAVQLAGACLCCWPETAKYFSYDVKLLAGGNQDVVEKLEQLFMGSSRQCAIYGGSFLALVTQSTKGSEKAAHWASRVEREVVLRPKNQVRTSPHQASFCLYTLVSVERDDMEREAGNLFLNLQQIIQKNGKDSDRIMTEAEQQKQNFSKRLKEVSSAFLKEFCASACERHRFQPYELADCASCHVIKATCNDPVLCAAGPNILAAVLVPLTVILLGAGAAVWYYRRKKEGEGEAKEQGDKETESSKDSESGESSEWSTDSDVPRLPAGRTSIPPYVNIPSPPAGHSAYENIPRAPRANIPDASYGWDNSASIPSPPHIWSP